MAVEILTGDCREVLKTLADQSVNCIVTSPPYFGLRDYGVEGQMGLEPTPAEFVEGMVEVFREVRRVLRDDGTLWLNIGDSYANDTKWGGSTSGKHVKAVHGATGIGRRRTNTGLKSKDMMMIPARLALGLQADGWFLRQDIIWSKPNPMPESVTDRCTKSHEYIFLLSKSSRYYFDALAIAEEASENSHGALRGDPGNKARQTGNHSGPLGLISENGLRNKRTVWQVATQPFKEAHFATFPPALIEPCILAGCPKGGFVLDPFGGAGTTGMVADRLGRNAILIELNPAYVEIARRRIEADAGMFAAVSG